MPTRAKKRPPKKMPFGKVPDIDAKMVAEWMFVDSIWIKLNEMRLTSHPQIDAEKVMGMNAKTTAQMQ